MEGGRENNYIETTALLQDDDTDEGTTRIV